MGAATVVRNLEIHDPTSEVVFLTVTDGDTYTSRKFGRVLAAHADVNALGSATTGLVANVLIDPLRPVTTVLIAASNGVSTANRSVTLVLYGLR